MIGAFVVRFTLLRHAYRLISGLGQLEPGHASLGPWLFDVGHPGDYVLPAGLVIRVRSPALVGY